MKSTTDYVPTGIKGVDEILANTGIPAGYVVFVIGSPGSGKTTLGLQFLYNGATKFGENGVYVSLDEDPHYLEKNAASMGLDLKKLIDEEKLVIVDASPIRFLPGEVKLGDISVGKREFALISLIDAIRKNVERIDAKRLVVDPLATLILQFPDARSHAGYSFYRLHNPTRFGAHHEFSAPQIPV